jgi:hypothetical protein
MNNPKAEALALRAAMKAKQHELRTEMQRKRRKFEQEKSSWENVMAFWESTGDKYKNLGELMESPEGIETRKLWSGELIKKYPTFKQFIASPEAAPLRDRYGLEPGK